MKLLLKIVGGVVVLVIIVVSTYYYYSKPRVVSSYSEAVTSCTSSDARDFYEKGEATYKRVGAEVGSSSGIGDACDYYVEGQFTRKGLLRQSFCEGNKLVTENIDCGIDSVCRQGRCAKGHIGEGKILQGWSICSDSDGGVDVKKRGWVEGLGAGMDECYISANVLNPEKDGSSTNQCAGSNCYVYEYYCDGDERAWKILSAPAGCENGAGK